MKIKNGVDIVHVPEFKEQMDKSKQKFISRVYRDSELKWAKKPQTLAGIFAAKEAITKALEIKIGDWKSMEIKKLGSGKPYVVLSKKYSQNIKSHDLSISHSGDYVIALYTLLLE